MVTVNGQLQQSWSDKDKSTEGSDTLVIKVWIASPDKQPRPAKVLAEGKEAIGWLVISFNYSIWDQL